MITDIMKAETFEKPSRVSFRRLSEKSIISVKRWDNGAWGTDYDWYHNGDKINEYEAEVLLAELKNK